MEGAVSAIVHYATVQLPRKPRLVPWVTLINLGDDRLQFRSAQSVFTLQHRFFIDVFHAIEQRLDGRHTVDEVAAAGGMGVEPTTVVFLLKMLRANGLLQEGEHPQSLTAGDLAHWERHFRFLAHFVPDPSTVLAMLRQVRVAVLGASPLANSIRSAIAALGVGEIPVVGPVVTSQNGRGSTGVSRLHGMDCVDFLVACQESVGFAVFDAVNAACLQSGTRWMRVAVEGTTALLGPTIVPYQTACYTCYDQRVQSHLPEPESFLAYREHLSRHEQRQDWPDEGMFAPLWSVIAGQVALEVARILTGFAPPATIGRFYELGASSPAAVGHDVLRVPRCPSCRPSSPTRAAWDGGTELLGSKE